jgi:TolB-like protein
MAAISGFLKEARRRRVFRTAAVYIVAAWVAVQVFSEALPAFEVPAYAIRFVWIAAILGFPLAVTFGWLYDVTPTGVRRTPPADHRDSVDLNLRQADYVILAALATVSLAIVIDLTGRVSDVDIEPSQLRHTDENSIAVLPFDNLTGDPAQAFFVNGMQAALINRLSSISGLRITSKTSTVAYSTVPKSAADIASELSVAWVVEGGVYRLGDEVRIALSLVDVKSDTSVWSDELDSSIADVLKLQSEAARLVARQVQVELTNDESARLAAAGTVTPAAYDAYLRGVFHTELFTPDDMRQAVGFFQRAVELDPTFVLAYAGLNKLCRFQLQAGLVRPREAAPRCNDLIMKALSLDDERAEVHSGLALGYWLYDYDWPAAESAFNRALELNPNFAEAHMFYSHFLMTLGRCEESGIEMRIARELDPLNPFVQALHGAQLAGCGNPDSGLKLIEETIAAFPQLGFGYDVLWWVSHGIGRSEDSLSAALQHFGVTMNQPEVAAAIHRGKEVGGYETAMLAAADALVELWHETYIPAYEIAMAFGYGGDIDKHFEWMNVAYEEHDPTLPYFGAIGHYAPALDDLRRAAVLERMHLDFWVDLEAK